MCISGPERKRGTKWALVGLQPNVREVPDQVQTAHRHLRGRDPVRIRSPIPNPTTAARGERRKGAERRRRGLWRRRQGTWRGGRRRRNGCACSTAGRSRTRSTGPSTATSSTRTSVPPISPLRLPLPLDLDLPPRSRPDLTSCSLSRAGVGSPGQVRGQPTRGKASSC